MKVCSPEKTACDGIYILHDTIQNGHIVYKQIENVVTGQWINQGTKSLDNLQLLFYCPTISEPYYIQWLKNKTGHYEWIIGKGMDKWVSCLL